MGILRRRIFDVRAIVAKFTKVRNLLKEAEEITDRKAKLDVYKTIEEKLRTEKQQIEINMFDDSQILSNLKELEKNSDVIYDYYRNLDNPECFRCTSLYKSYSIDENEDFRGAVAMFARLKRVQQSAIATPETN